MGSERGRRRKCEPTKAIAAHEHYYGAFQGRKASLNLETLRLLLRDFAIVPFDREDARASGEIRGDLAVKGTPIG